MQGQGFVMSTHTLSSSQTGKKGEFTGNIYRALPRSQWLCFCNSVLIGYTHCEIVTSVSILQMRKLRLRLFCFVLFFHLFQIMDQSQGSIHTVYYQSPIMYPPCHSASSSCFYSLCLDSLSATLIVSGWASRYVLLFLILLLNTFSMSAYFIFLE